MIVAIVRIVAVLAMAICAIGWVWFPTIARFDAFLGLATVFAFVVTTQFFVARYNKLNEHDQHLFNEFRALFSDRSLIQIFRDHDFLISFRREYMAPLQTVVAVWDDAAHAFTNRKLEEKRVTFVKAATELAMMIWNNTVPSYGGDHITVIPRDVDPENLPEHIRQEAREINALVPPFVAAHEDLIRTANGLGATPRARASSTQGQA